MKRIFDFFIALTALIIFLPLLLIISILISLYDFHSPFYIAPRIGRHGKAFKMIKFRSMIVNADKTGVTSTSNADNRITPVGRFVRKYKLDELVQLWNVLIGDMSLVGPRPNVKSGTDLYTKVERRLLDVRPGVTDFSSIVFADEGDILQGYADPDDAYDRLIRPGKSRLGLFYVEHHGLLIDIKLIAITLLAVISRNRALRAIVKLLKQINAPAELVAIASRAKPLEPSSPP